MAAFEKSCRLIRLIWSPLLPFIYSIISMRSIIVTFRHLDTILLPFVYWKRYLWSMSAPPTNLVNWSKWSEPLFERSLTLSVSDLSVKLLWTLTSPHVAIYSGNCFSVYMSGVQLDARASRDGYNSVRQLLSVDNAGFQFFWCGNITTSALLSFPLLRYVLAVYCS